jgi:hypothetical protein
MRKSIFTKTSKITFTLLSFGMFLLSSTIYGATTCGIEGTIEERIYDCELKNPALKGNHSFVMVSKLEDLNGAEREIYQDSKTGILWSDRLASEFVFSSALKACTSPQNTRTGGITEVTWELPTIEDYKTAEVNGMRQALPRMNDVFWTSSRWDGFSGGAFFFMGKIGAESYGGLYVPRSIRCIGKLKP